MSVARIFDAAGIAAELRATNLPPLELLHSDADKLRRELDRLLEHAESVAAELEQADDRSAGFQSGKAWIVSSKLNSVRKAIALAHMQLVPRDDPRYMAARRTADYLSDRGARLTIVQDDGKEAA